MQLVSIAPHPDYGEAFEVHGFVCERCGRTQTYTLRRRARVEHSAGQLRRDRRSPGDH